MCNKILQGKKYKVEIARDDHSELISKLQNIDGILYFKTNTPHTPKKESFLRARITVPSLSYIKSTGGVNIKIIEFQSDSLRVILEKGGTFTGYDAKFKHLFLKTSGNTQVKFVDTE